MPGAVLGTSHGFSHPHGDATSWQMDSLLPLYDGGNGDLAFEELAQDHRANESENHVHTQTRI